MALHHDLPIHKAGAQLLELVTEMHRQMPRGYKRSVGDRVISHCSEMLDLMALANASVGNRQARVMHLQEILRRVRAAQVWLRIGLNVKAIAIKPWSAAIQMLNSIGAQAQGWLNKTNGKAPAA